MQILQQLIQGLSLGSIYGLVALGYVLIYQAWGVLNFAQGEVCAIGAVAGMLLAPVYLFNASIGATIGTKGYAAAVLGGLDFASGAMVGGIILGIAECLAVAFGSSAYQSAIAYIVLFLVLILKPSGIMSKKKTVEKV